MNKASLNNPREATKEEKEAFYNKCDRAFDRFVAAVEDRFDVHAKEEDEYTVLKPKGHSIFYYGFYQLMKNGHNTGIEISAYVEDERNGDALRLRYYARSAIGSEDSNYASDVVAFIDESLKMNESYIIDHEDNHERNIIFRQYKDINGIFIGYVDEKVAFEAVKKLNEVMKFIEENGGEIEGTFKIY